MTNPPLGFHLLPGSVGGDWAQWAAFGSPFVKVLDAALIGPTQQMGAKVVYRPCFLPGDDGEGATGDGQKWAGDVIDQIASNGHHWPSIVQFRNEMDQADANRVVVEYQKFRRALRQAGYPGLVGLGSYGVGWPDWPQYPILMTAQPDCLILDEYFGRTVAGSPDLALRHVEAIRRGLLPPALPLFIGECGADRCGDGTDGRGWRDKLTPGQMAAQLAIYRAGCAPSVVAAFVYTDGDNGDPQWASFKTRGTPVEAAIRATWPATTPQRAQDAPTAPATTKGAPMAGYSKATWVPSPNYFPGRHGMAVTTVVLHATAGPNAVSWFRNPASQVSAHYVVGEDASTTQCVDETDSAWHAGVVTPDSVYAGGPNPNYFSVGIEHERSVGNDNPMPEAQIRASLALVADLLRRYGPLTLVTHDRIDIGRVCPGPGFPLARFLALLQPAPAPVPAPTPTPAAQEVEAVITITPAIRAAAVDRYAALGIQPLQQGAIFAEFLARYAVGQANPTHNAILPTPALTPEVTPDASGDAYALFDDGSIWAWRKAKGAVYLLEEKDRAATMKLCGWAGRFA